MKNDLARLSSRLELLEARADRPAAPAEIDPAKIARLVDERMRESIVMATGKARMRPDELPQSVKNAAAKALKGAAITKAEQRHKKGRTYYKLKVRLGGASSMASSVEACGSVAPCNRGWIVVC